MRLPCTTAVPGALPRPLGAGAASSVRASRTATRAGPAAGGSWAAALPRGAGRLVHEPFGAILKPAFAAGDGAPHVDRRHRHEGVGYRHHRQERYEERRHAPSSPSPPTCPRSIDVREERRPKRGLVSGYPGRAPSYTLPPLRASRHHGRPIFTLRKRPFSSFANLPGGHRKNWRNRERPPSSPVFLATQLALVRERAASLSARTYSPPPGPPLHPFRGILFGHAAMNSDSRSKSTSSSAFRSFSASLTVPVGFGTPRRTAACQSSATRPSAEARRLRVVSGPYQALRVSPSCGRCPAVAESGRSLPHDSCP